MIKQINIDNLYNIQMDSSKECYILLGYL